MKIGKLPGKRAKPEPSSNIVRRRGVFLRAFVLLFACGSFSVVFAQEGMEQINPSSFSSNRRPPAVFRHDAHNEKANIEDCKFCHHVYNENGQRLQDVSSEDSRCAACHPKRQVGKTVSLEKAFHQRCLGCHRALDKGPVLCGNCHIKKR